MKALKHWNLYVAALLLASCAQFGIPAAQTFNEKALAVQLGIAEARTTNANLLDAKAISSKDGQNIRKTADILQEGVDVAREVALTDLKTAEGKLSAVRTSLTALSAYLASRKK